MAEDPLPPEPPVVNRLRVLAEREIEQLAELLIDCVDGGAGVSFVHPLAPAKASAFWRRIAEGVTGGTHVLLVCEDDCGIVGTVQLIVDMPENQPHRADLAKMLVHRRARRQGVGAALLAAAEEHARALGRTLLVLDTNTGSDAERLYERCGWTRVGEIPGFSVEPRGGLRASTVLYKQLHGS